MTPTLYAVLVAQALVGAFDNLWHHELQARLPHRASARRELALHATRESIYGLLFLVVAWLEARGLWAVVLGVLLAVELVVTLADFLEEDRTRKLPPFERVLHTVLAVLYGVFLATMAPVLVGWSALPTALVPVDRGGVSLVFTVFALGVLAWSVRNAVACRRPDLPRPARDPAGHRPSFTTLVTGGTGFVGSALIDALLHERGRVLVLTRDRLRAVERWGDAVTAIERLDAVPDDMRIDAIVHLAGARVLGLPWTHRRRRTLLQSRTDLTRALIALTARLHTRPEVLVAASATGYYGIDPGLAAFAQGRAADESGPAMRGQFASDLCAAAEAAALRARALGVRVVALRLGLVLGRSGGALPMQALAARLGAGAVLGSGRQPMPWIHLDDAVGLIRFVLHEPQLHGALNAVAPDACTQDRFARTLARVHGRRVHLRMPAWPLRLVGGQMMSLLLDGRDVVPRAALAAGYRFRYPLLQPALAGLAAITARSRS